MMPDDDCPPAACCAAGSLPSLVTPLNSLLDPLNVCLGFKTTPSLLVQPALPDEEGLLDEALKAESEFLLALH